VLIDYQPSQFATVRSMDADLLRKNIISTVRAGIERETVPQVVEIVLTERLLQE
jgi:hypothetical protein